MVKRIASLLMLIALSGGVLAGVPLHSGERNCPMPDCCKKAQSGSNTPKASAARLCCALNCAQPGTTTPANAFNFSPSVNVIPHSPVALRPASASGVVFARPNSPPDYRQRYDPAYIRHLALLI